MPISLSAEIGRRKMVGDTGAPITITMEGVVDLPEDKHIASICAHNDALYVATDDSKILIYRIT